MTEEVFDAGPADVDAVGVLVFDDDHFVAAHLASAVVAAFRVEVDVAEVVVADREHEAAVGSGEVDDPNRGVLAECEVALVGEGQLVARLVVCWAVADFDGDWLDRVGERTVEPFLVASGLEGVELLGDDRDLQRRPVAVSGGGVHAFIMGDP